MQLHLPARRRIGLLGGVALTLFVLVAAALAVFWFYLADYQDNLPQNHANWILAAYQTGDALTIRSYCDNLPDELRDPADFTRYYTQYARLDSLYFYPGVCADADGLVYEFAAGDTPVATLTLRKSADKSRFGFARYEIASLAGKPLVSYTVHAPADVEVFANGKRLSEDFRGADTGDVENFLPLGNDVYRIKTYQTTDLLYINELSAFGRDGSDCVVTWSADGREAVVEKQVTDAQRTQITDFATRFSEVYTVFATRRAGPGAPVRRLLYPGTPFADALQLYNNDWGENYIDARYENKVIDGFTRYAQTAFSCNVRFDYVIRPADGLEKAYPFDMTYYLTCRDGVWLLVDMQSR